MTRPYVLLDLSYLCYRALYSVGDLSYEDLPTGVLFGFFSQLRSICEDHRINSNRVVVFADAKGSIRKDVYPAYKGNRREKSVEELQRMDVVHDQRRLLERDILPAIGISVYKQPGLESDDLIAQAAKQIVADRTQNPHNAQRPPEGIIITADSDLYQCISEQVHWFDPARGLYHTPKSFVALKLLPPQAWGYVKCLAGCKTDNVDGIPNIGEASAVQFLLGKMPKHHARYKAIDSKKGREIAKRNKALVVLPHKETKPFSLTLPDYQPKEFFRMCKRYGMVSFLREEESWRAFFRGPRDMKLRGRKKAKRG